MGLHFEWREISTDGLLKVPQALGQYYDCRALSNDYDTVEAAVADYKDVTKGSPHAYGYLTLITIYDPRD